MLSKGRDNTNLSNVHDRSKGQKAADIAGSHTSKYHGAMVVKLHHTPAQWTMHSESYMHSLMIRVAARSPVRPKR